MGDILDQTERAHSERYIQQRAINSLTAIRVPEGTKNSRPVGFLQ